MQYGFNLLLLTGHVTEEHTAILKAHEEGRLGHGGDSVFEGTRDYFAKLGDQLDKSALNVSTVSVMGPGKTRLAATRRSGRWRWTAPNG